MKTEWLWQGPSLVTFSLLLLFTLFFLISLYMDRKDSRYFPDKDKEAAFWPLKEPNKEEVEGDDLEIDFDVRYLIAVLSQIDEEQVVLETTQSNRPGTIRPLGLADEEFLHVVMPMHPPR